MTLFKDKVSSGKIAPILLPKLLLVLVAVILAALYFTNDMAKFSDRESSSAQQYNSVSTDSLKNSSITFEKIDPLVWNIVMKRLADASGGSQPSTQPSITSSNTPTANVTNILYNNTLVSSDNIDLGTKTNGDYIKSIVAGAGLLGGISGEGVVASLSIGAGAGITVSGDGVALNLATGSGLVITGGALGLLNTCSDGQVFKWNNTTQAWECNTDLSGSGGTLTVRESDGTPSVTSIAGIEFGPSAGSSDEFIVTNQGGGVARIRSGTAIPLSNAATTIGSAWTFSSNITANGGLSCLDCISLGSETTGNYLASLLAGSGLTVSGASAESATPTVSLDSSLAMFKTINTSLGTDPIADTLTDTLSLNSGDGVLVTGDATTDTVSFSLSLASGGGLVVAGGALSLLNTCSDGQLLAWAGLSSAWSCTTVSTLPPSLFKTITGDTGTATADGATDTVAIIGGSGLVSTVADTPDTVTLDIDLASGSGLTFSGGALSLSSCSDGQILKRITGAWTCSADNNFAAGSFRQHLAGESDVTVGSVFSPLVKSTDLVGPQSLPITIESGNYVAVMATVEINSSLTGGAVTYAVIRDDNSDNDCVSTAGDGTRIGGWVGEFISSPAQDFTTSFSFIDTNPGVTNPRYQLCASTTIATGSVKVADRSLRLDERRP